MSSAGFAIHTDAVGDSAIFLADQATLLSMNIAVLEASIATWRGDGVFTGDPVDRDASALLDNSLAITNGVAGSFRNDAELMAQSARNYDTTEHSLKSLANGVMPAGPSSLPAWNAIWSVGQSYGREYDDSEWTSSHQVHSIPLLPPVLSPTPSVLFRGDPQVAHAAAYLLTGRANLVHEATEKCTVRVVDLLHGGSWGGAASVAFAKSFSRHARLGLDFADSAVRLASAFDSLATSLYDANKSGLDAMNHSTDWGVNIDSNGNIMGVNSHLGFEITVYLVALAGTAIFAPPAAPFVLGAEVLLGAGEVLWAIHQMKAANAAAQEARQRFAAAIVSFQQAHHPGW